MAVVRKVRPGDPLSIAARDWNVLADLANDAIGNNSPFGFGGLPQLRALAKNVDANDMEIGDVFGISDVLFDEATAPREFKYQTKLKVERKAFSSAWDRIAIAVVPIKAGKSGPVVVGGLAIANIDVTNAGKVASLGMTASANAIVSGIGGLRILHRPAGSGVKKCLVEFGEVGAIVAKAPVGGIPAASSGGLTPSSASCDVHTWNGTSWVDSGHNVNVYNMATAAVAANALIQAKPFGGEIFQVDWEACP